MQYSTSHKINCESQSVNSGRQVVVIGVSYRTDVSAINFVKSIASVATPNTSIVLVDNTERADFSLFRKVGEICPTVICLASRSNLGYLGGAHFGLVEYLKRVERFPTWIVVSNVDVEFKEGAFFSCLEQIPQTGSIGVLAPSIWSTRGGYDRNPHMLRRLGHNQVRFYKFIYRHYPLALGYSLFSKMKHLVLACLPYKKSSKGLLALTALGEKSDGDLVYAKADRLYPIYAPHGSCIVFSGLYFEKGASLNYPSFLFQEEIFVAEQARHYGLEVLYAPKLRVFHEGHVSTGEWRSPKMYSHFYNSTVVIERLFYNT